MIDEKEIKELKNVDAKLMDVSKDLKPLYYAEPQNDAEQKKAFLAGDVINPSFVYRAEEYDPFALWDTIHNLDIPDSTLGQILKTKREHALLENRVIACRGDEDVVRSATIQLHGTPDARLVEHAESLLRDLPTDVSVKDVPASRIKEALEKNLHAYGIDDWTVELTKKRLINTNSSLKRISVCEDRLFSRMDVLKLPVHEIGVHVLRAANGFRQPLEALFGLGLPGYLATEEGLTSYFEEKTGNIDSETRRSYAGRVIAVNSVVQGLDFRRTYDRLRDHKFDCDAAWGLSVRAHRAGGYIKDHVYLDGHLKVENFIKGGGNVENLYVGKVGIDNLSLIDELLDEGFLKRPLYLHESM